MVTYNCYCHTEDWTVLFQSPFMQCDFTAVCHCVVAATSVPCVVWVHLRFCHSVAIPLSCYSNMAHLTVQWQWHLTQVANICHFVNTVMHLLWHNMLLRVCTVYYSLLQFDVPQTLIHKFVVAAVRGVSKNNNITEFQLEPHVGDQQVDGILAQLTADERRRFKVGHHGWPFIELCPVGEWCIVSLLMQCLCCVSEVLSEVYQRSSLSLPSWLCGLGGTSCLLCVNRVPPVGGGVAF